MGSEEWGVGIRDLAVPMSAGSQSVALAICLAGDGTHVLALNSLHGTRNSLLPTPHSALSTPHSFDYFHGPDAPNPEDQA